MGEGAGGQAGWEGRVYAFLLLARNYDEPALEDAERVATLLDWKANLDPALGDNVDALCSLPRVREAHLVVEKCTSHAFCTIGGIGAGKGFASFE